MSNRGLVGQIISRYEAKGLALLALELRTVDADLAAKHYAEHVGRAYYPDLERFICSGPLVAMVLQGERAIEAVRALNGITDSAVAAPAPSAVTTPCSRTRTWCMPRTPDSACREIALWFPELG